MIIHTVTRRWIDPGTEGDITKWDLQCWEKDKRSGAKHPLGRARVCRSGRTWFVLDMTLGAWLARDDPNYRALVEVVRRYEQQQLERAEIEKATVPLFGTEEKTS